MNIYRITDTPCAEYVYEPTGDVIVGTTKEGFLIIKDDRKRLPPRQGPSQPWDPENPF